MHIFVTDSRHDTVRGVFPELQTELWNKDQTMLTLWLDPGRIKRGLQPNNQMGAPLRPGEAFHLSISDLEALDGITQEKTFTKIFLVAARDSLSPTPARWTVGIPEANTLQPLRIDFHETLDYALLHEAITVLDASGRSVRGNLEITHGETGTIFTPGIPWARGVYTIALQSRLEDAAGNNLDRPFDAVAAVSAAVAPKKKSDLQFKIE